MLTNIDSLTDQYRSDERLIRVTFPSVQRRISPSRIAPKARGILAQQITSKKGHSVELPSPHNRKAQLHPIDEAGTPFAKYFSIFWAKHRPISLMQSVKKDGDTPILFYYSTHLFLVIRGDTCKGRLKFFGGAKLLAFTQETSHLCYTNSKQSYRASNLTVTSPDQRLTNTHGCTASALPPSELRPLSIYNVPTPHIVHHYDP